MWYAVWLLVTGLALSGAARAEDMQLRARAVLLLDAAQAASSIRGGPFILRTESTFTATADDGSVKSGSYTRLRAPTGSLRQEVRFGDWQTTNILTDGAMSTVGPWYSPPFAVRRLFNLIPFRTGAFDEKDVVRAIRDGSSQGQPATCVDYDTVHGEHHSANELCVNKADGTLLSDREDGRVYEWSRYTRIEGVGAVYPQHIDYSEGSDFTLHADLSIRKLDRLPEDAFLPPAGASASTFCKTFGPPVPIRAPQPEGKGAPDAPVVNVVVHLFVNADGTVAQPQVVHANHPELDSEALKLAQSWAFQPGTCNGSPSSFSTDIVLHFQGR